MFLERLNQAAERVSAHLQQPKLVWMLHPTSKEVPYFWLFAVAQAPDGSSCNLACMVNPMVSYETVCWTRSHKGPQLVPYPTKQTPNLIDFGFLSLKTGEPLQVRDPGIVLAEHYTANRDQYGAQAGSSTRPRFGTCL